MKLLFAHLAFAAAALAQPPHFENGKFEATGFGGSLSTQLASFGSGPYWAGYSEPAAPRRKGVMCNSNQLAEAPVRLEGQTAVVILVRITSGHTDEMKILSPDCRIDVGGLALHWIENVPAAQSIAWLQTIASNPAFLAISLHAAPEAITALIDAAGENPDSAIRRKAMFWLGQSSDPRAFDFFARILQP